MYYSFVLVPLFIMISSDFKERKISINTLACFAGIQLLAAFLYSDTETIATNFIFNNNIMAFFALPVFFYSRWRFGNKKECFGLGDILFIISLTPLFDLYRFVYFMVISAMFTLGWWGISHLCRFGFDTVPFISTLGICYGLYVSNLCLYG